MPSAKHRSRALLACRLVRIYGVRLPNQVRAVAFHPETGQLDLRPDSPAYATQLRLISSQARSAIRAWSAAANPVGSRPLWCSCFSVAVRRSVSQAPPMFVCRL